ncbi:MAG TPA: hypothetical protein VNJ08_15815 [Bacteriovoracaceae bacterium]|nr:hypothetical protein [Bacteriovoracaceae bacterium]
MDVKIVKDLAQKYTAHELLKFADDFESSGIAPVKTQEDPGDQMSDYLQAAELRYLIDQGMNVNEALREFSKRVRGVLT